MRTKILMMIGGALTALALTAAPAYAGAGASASAEPRPLDCKSGFGWQSDYTWARCDGGAGAVRAVATCSNGSSQTTAYGPWVGIRVQSSAHCPNSHPRAVNHSYQTSYG